MGNDSTECNIVTPPINSGLSTFEILIVTFQVAIMIPIVFGNILVLCAFKRFHHLQTPTGKFIANLAVADLCLGLSLPFQMSFFFYPQLNLNKEACLLRFEMIIFTSMSSLLSLFFTVVDRYVAVLHPLRYYMIMSDRLANILISVVWMYAFLLAALPILGYNSFHSAMFCAYELVMTKTYRLFVALHFITLPIIMFCIYFRVFYIAWSHKKKILSEQSIYFSNVKIQREKKTARIMVTLSLAFSLCWLPFSITTVIQIVEFNKTRAFVSNFLVFFGLLNSVINPIIYVWKNQQYKAEFKKILCFWKTYTNSEPVSMETDNVTRINVQHTSITENL